jgi:hypothetical protein
MWGLPQAVSRALGSPVDVTFLSGNDGPYLALLMALRAVATWPRPASVVWQLGEAYLFAGPDASNVWLDDALMAPRSFLDQVARLVA